ncbi:hypothetical protein CXG81DRAFT_21167 [Caulochytrium protostelioides]|uniref:Small-subunit processome Utp12 domain-containing protein n=1 Tax=Caulochytrium protostelioides TaxID=1555241 RepID=A0A4P9WYT6_9FUNG|nr:hypothetical protein CXG81DRAFT_21167 [Caulochytrium protostelioides]|eukprot:RKO98634.1 hypothetical protein CXG81DRAFT_21167 [Caulochytrium protostelioides]
MGVATARKANKHVTMFNKAPTAAAAVARYTLTAFSPSRHLMATVVPSFDVHTLTVHDTRSGAALGSFTPQSRITSLCYAKLVSAAAAAPADSARATDAAADAALAKDSAFDVFVVGLASGALAVWSVRRNALVTTLSDASSSQPIVSLAPASRAAAHHVAALAADGSACVWDLATAAVLRRFQVPAAVLGSDGQAHTLVALGADAWLVGAAGLAGRLAADGTLAATYAGHTQPVNQLAPVGAAPETAASHFVSASTGERYANLWRADSAQSPQHVLQLPFDLRTLHTQPDADAALIAGDKQVAVYLELAASADAADEAAASAAAAGKAGAKKKKVKMSAQRMADTLVTVTAPVLATALVAGAAAASVELLIVTGKPLEPSFRLVPLKDSEGHVLREVTVTVTAKTAETMTLLSKAAAADPLEAAAHTLDGLSLPSAAHGAPSFGAQVADLTVSRSAANTETPAAASVTNAAATANGKSAHGRTNVAGGRASADSPLTSESLNTLLAQALQSHDRALLLRVIAVQDARVIQTTVSRLSSSAVAPFAEALLHRLHSGPGAMSQVLPWLRVVLVVHASFLLGNPGVVALLGRLHQQLVNRTENFSELLKLSGKLDLVLSSARLREQGTGVLNDVALVNYAEKQDDEDEDDVDSDVSDASGASDDDAADFASVDGGDSDADSDAETVDETEDDDEADAVAVNGISDSGSDDGTESSDEEDEEAKAESDAARMAASVDPFASSDSECEAKHAQVNAEDLDESD